MVVMTRASSGAMPAPWKTRLASKEPIDLETADQIEQKNKLWRWCQWHPRLTTKCNTQHDGNKVNLRAWMHRLESPWAMQETGRRLTGRRPNLVLTGAATNMARASDKSIVPLTDATVFTSTPQSAAMTT